MLVDCNVLVQEILLFYIIGHATEQAKVGENIKNWAMVERTYRWIVQVDILEDRFLLTRIHLVDWPFNKKSHVPWIKD